MRTALSLPPEPGPAADGGVHPLPIGGWEKLSAVDWPSQLAAVIFLQGCAWRCGYCHNPHLIPFTPAATAPAWSEVHTWLHRRVGLLDAVVFSGGEPTWHNALAAAMRQTRDLGFKIGLHTGGPAPERLAKLLPWLDWVGFDFKAPFHDYAKVTGRDDGAAAERSLRHLLANGTPCEIRTTWHPRLLSESDLQTMADTLVKLGCAEWVIQRFRPDGCADPALAHLPVGDPPLNRLQRDGLQLVLR